METKRQLSAASASVVPPGAIPRGANFILGGLAGYVIFPSVISSFIYLFLFIYFCIGWSMVVLPIWCYSSYFGAVECC